MTLAEKFDIRALDPILRDAAERRRARETMAAPVEASGRVRALRMIGLLALLEDGTARTLVAMLDRLPPAHRPNVQDRFAAARDGSLIRRAGWLGDDSGRHPLWRITAKGRARLAALRGGAT